MKKKKQENMKIKVSADVSDATKEIKKLQKAIEELNKTIDSLNKKNLKIDIKVKAV